MKKYLMHIGIGVGVVFWLIIIGSMLIEAAQQWYMHGEMAGIDGLQVAAIVGIPVTILCSMASFAASAALLDLFGDK